MRNPFEIVEWFEEAIAEYTGAPYAISCDSCTDAIFLCCKYLEVQGSTITIPLVLIFPLLNPYYKPEPK